MTVSSSWCQGLRIILIERRRKKGVRLHKAAVYVRAVGCVRLRDCSLVMLLFGCMWIDSRRGKKQLILITGKSSLCEGLRVILREEKKGE